MVNSGLEIHDIHSWLVRHRADICYFETLDARLYNGVRTAPASTSNCVPSMPDEHTVFRIAKLMQQLSNYVERATISDIESLKDSF